MAVHSALRLLTHRLAGQYSGKTFFVIELGGLGGRMLLVMAAVSFVLLWTPVPKIVFVGTVLLLLVLSIIVEVRFILGRGGSG